MQIGYGKGHSNAANFDFFVPQQEVFFQADAPIAGLQIYSYKHVTENYYSVQRKTQINQELLIKNVFQFDLFETIFFHISRFEEHYPGERRTDRWDMLCAEEHLLVHHKLHQIPVVDQLVEVFFRVLGYPPNALSRQLIWTHDVDALRLFPNGLKTLRGFIRRILRREFSAFYRMFTRWLGQVINYSVDPYDTFEQLLDAAEDSPKCMFLMSGGALPLEGYYDIDSREALNLIHLAASRGYTIGLHPSYLTWKREDLMRKEKDRLSELTDTAIRTSRQHYLHFAFPDTLTVLEACGITHDFSLGYQDRIGFRCGTAYTYALYSFPDERESMVVETPLIIMDKALRDEAKRTRVSMTTLLNNFLDRQQTGQLCINVHNSSFDDIDWNSSEMRSILEQLHSWKESIC
ncbi:MAG: hypothetical protein K9I85_05170 [Saprospiraceae bacterium]|nr:hypothetical protein [Saprospiraceae bacterium]